MAAAGTAPASEVKVVSAPALRVSFTWTLAGNLIYALCQFGQLSALAKLGSAAIVGRYALALAITAPVFMLTNLQLRGMQATDARREFEFADYFTLRTISTLLGITVIIGITLFLHFDLTTKALILLVAFGKGVETISDVIAGHLQKFERLDQVSRSLMLRGVASLLTFATAFWYTRSLIVAVIAQAATWTATVTCYDFRIVSKMLGVRRQFFHSCAKTLRSMIAVAWPLGLVMAMVSLNTNVPRYILEKKLGPGELGIFASLAYLLTAIGLIVVALGQSVCTRMSKQFAEKDVHGFNLLLTKLICFAALLGVAGVGFALFAGRPLLTIIYGPQYAEHVNLLLIMVATASVNAISSFLGFAMTAARRFRAQLPVLGATVATTFSLTLLLVPHFGLMGSGYALFTAAAVQSSASYLVLRSAMNAVKQDSGRLAA